jgi:hypothetical protein
MEFEIGIACGACDTYNPIGTARCSACGNDLALVSRSNSRTNPNFRAVAQPPAQGAALDAAPAEPLPPVAAPAALRPFPAFRSAGQATADLSSAAVEIAKATAAAAPVPEAPRAPQPGGISRRPLAPDLPLSPPDAAAREASEPRLRPAQSGSVGPKQPPSFAHLSQEELMDQARHYLCWQCYTPVPSGHKFCGRCGAAVPDEILNARTLYFSDMQNPAKARLVLIRGEGMDGLSYHLKMEQHVVGRKGQIPFPDDPFVSPKHANFFYRDGKLVVRDEGSLNGVYLRVRGSVDINPTDTFLAGEQVFKLDAAPRLIEYQDAEGTMFYGSPRYPSTFRITQILQGGAMGMTVCARGNTLQLGREGGDLNFPGDIYMSSSHCRIEDKGGQFTLTDMNSRNGTYIRVMTERELGHGDYLFIGRKLMRVELNA